jgi:hypothetical protein
MNLPNEVKNATELCQCTSKYDPIPDLRVKFYFFPDPETGVEREISGESPH